MKLASRVGPHKVGPEDPRYVHLAHRGFNRRFRGRPEYVRLVGSTADVVEARRRRDDLLRRYPEERGCALSLRIGARATRGTRRCAPMRSPVAA